MNSVSLPILAAAALLALTAMPAAAITLPVAEDSSSSAINGRLTALTGSATSMSASSQQAAFVRFDLSQLPAAVTAANVTSATLHVYVLTAIPGTTGVGAFTVTSAWHETGVTFFPTSDANSGVLLSNAPVSKGFISGDVTAAIRDALGSGPDFGFLISTNAGRVILSSKEGPGLGYAATLDIETSAPDANGNSVLGSKVGIASNVPAATLDIVHAPDVANALDTAVWVRKSAGNSIFLMRTFAAGGSFNLELFEGDAFKPGGGSWGVVSDRRLKKNIEPLSGALDRLMKLRSVTYEYKDPEKDHQLPGTQIGFVAQEVEEVFPDWVGEKDGSKYVAVKGFESLTVQALREMREEKDAQIEKLRAENASLAERLTRLEKTLDNSAARTVSASLDLKN